MFNLRGLSLRGLPHQQIITHMEGYFVEGRESDLVVHTLDFEIDSASIGDWIKRVDRIVNELEKCVFDSVRSADTFIGLSFSEKLSRGLQSSYTRIQIQILAISMLERVLRALRIM